MVVDGGVDVVIARTANGGRADAAAVQAPATAVGDAPDLLHIEVDQRARVVVFVAVGTGSGGPDDLPGDRVQAASGGTWYRRRIRDTVRAGTPVTAAMRAGPCRSSDRASRTACSRSVLVLVGIVLGLLERSRSRPRLRPETGSPTGKRTAERRRLFCDVRDRAAILEHTTDEQPPAMDRQSGITVRARGPPSCERRQTSPLSPEVLLRHKPRTVTNLVAEYT